MHDALSPYDLVFDALRRRAESGHDVAAIAGRLDGQDEISFVVACVTGRARPFR